KGRALADIARLFISFESTAIVFLSVCYCCWCAGYSGYYCACCSCCCHACASVRLSILSVLARGKGWYHIHRCSGILNAARCSVKKALISASVTWLLGATVMAAATASPKRSWGTG